MSSSSHSFRFLLGVMFFSRLFRFCFVVFVCLFVIAFFGLSICFVRTSCLGVSQDYLGAGEKNRVLALAPLPYKLQLKYPKQAC